jgi:hypothetical protein
MFSFACLPCLDLRGGGAGLSQLVRHVVRDGRVVVSTPGENLTPSQG